MREAADDKMSVQSDSAPVRNAPPPLGFAPRTLQVDELAPPVDLTARIVYFPVRHHSPACAWHVGRLIQELRPASVLIEGPRDATSLLPLLAHEETRMPVAWQ